MNERTAAPPNTFLEPMQGAQLKMMGVVKPWEGCGRILRLSSPS